MLGLIVRRLIGFVPTLLLVSLGVFLLTELMPGDPARTLAGGVDATPESVAAVRESLNLDAPPVERYFAWVGDVLHFDLGQSMFSGSSVMSDILAKTPVTAGLVLGAAVVAFLIGLPLGIAGGVRPGGMADRVGRVVATLGSGIPNFWLAALLIIVFAVQLGWLPPSGYVSPTRSLGGWLESIAMPSVALGLYLASQVSRQLRSSLSHQLDSSYVRTMWAKGASPRVVIGTHALRGAAPPVVTVLGVELARLMGATVIIEQIFAIPGLGNYLLDGAITQDLPVIQGVALVFVVMQMAMSLLVDIGYGLLNPKVRSA